MRVKCVYVNSKVAVVNWVRLRSISSLFGGKATPETADYPYRLFTIFGNH